MKDIIKITMTYKDNGVTYLIGYFIGTPYKGYNKVEAPKDEKLKRMLTQYNYMSEQMLNDYRQMSQFNVEYIDHDDWFMEMI
ncbi:MAG: hypothetical protein GY861_16040 [bacterium]|nr:hypothetical protein [bacterium]